MKKNIFKHFELKIKFYTHKIYYFNTIYFLQGNKNNNNNLKKLKKINSTTDYFEYKELLLNDGIVNKSFVNELLDKNNTLLFLDFNDATHEDLSLFLNFYNKNTKLRKNPIIILNEPKKYFKNRKKYENIKKMNLLSCLTFNYSKNIRIKFMEFNNRKLKSNRQYILGFTFFNFISFLFMSLFGLTTNYVKMSALLETMTYFMDKEPVNSRIHGVYYENFDDDEYKFSREVFNKYSNLQNKTTSYGFREMFNSYYIAGTPKNFVNLNARFIDCDSDYHFETKIMGTSYYSNQNKILMEKIDLEQYLIKEYSHHSPVNNAEAVYYMPSNIADDIIASSKNGEFETYSDFIGKVLLVSYDYNDIHFEQTMSINNIFYTSDVEENVGGAMNDKEYVNIYSGKDKNMGRYLLQTFGNFGLSTTTKLHGIFSSTFCIDFFGQNKALKMMLEQNFSKELKETNSYFDFSYLNKNTEEYGFELNKINDYFKSSNIFFQEKNFLLPLTSLIIVTFSFYIFSKFLLKSKSETITPNFKNRFLIFPLLILTPFITIQLLFLTIIFFAGHYVWSVGLLNVIGSPFSLVCSFLFMIYYLSSLNQDEKNVFKIKI